MLAIERKSEILSVLQTKKSVLVSELSKKYNVTEETIRRDLERLDKEGLVKRTYGGAVLRKNISIDPPYHVREKINKEEKRIIARKVFDLIEDHDNIMLDGSSTSVIIAKKLREKKRLTIITNSVEILLDYAECKNINVISTGGELRGSSLSLVGRNAERMLSNYTVDKAVISCKGLDFAKGITESNQAEMEIKKTMVACARETILAVDLSKFDKMSFLRLVEFNQIDTIVCEAMPTLQWMEYLEKNNIKIIY